MPTVNRIARFGIVNAYLVEEDDGLTLIDTGLPGSEKKLSAAAGKAGKPIARILLTHAHGDHIGSLDALAEAHPDAEVIISKRDERLLRKDKQLDPGEPTDKLRGQYPGAEAKVDRMLEGGDTVGSLQVIPSPGHTPGHIALLDTRDQTLYCGDAYSTLGGVATCAKVNPAFPLPALATWSKDLSLESARALLDLSPARLAPGHGKVVESPAEAMRAAIAKAS